MWAGLELGGLRYRRYEISSTPGRSTVNARDPAPLVGCAVILPHVLFIVKKWSSTRGDLTVLPPAQKGAARPEEGHGPLMWLPHHRPSHKQPDALPTRSPACLPLCSPAGASPRTSGLLAFVPITWPVCSREELQVRLGHWAPASGVGTKLREVGGTAPVFSLLGHGYVKCSGRHLSIVHAQK